MSKSTQCLGSVLPFALFFIFGCQRHNRDYLGITIHQQSCHIKGWSPMNRRNFWEVLFLFESFNPLVALEWSFPSVRSHVLLQMTGFGASVVALVTFERLFSCMLPHCVNFQISCCYARIHALICIYMALHESASFYAFAGSLDLLFNIDIDCNDTVNPQCAS